MYAKIHKQGPETLVAACDKDIAGQTFRGDGTKIDVYESFYCGEQVTEEELVALMRDATILNLTGNRVIDLAIREGFVDPSAVLTIGEVRHAQAVVLL